MTDFKLLEKLCTVRRYFPGDEGSVNYYKRNKAVCR